MRYGALTFMLSLIIMFNTKCCSSSYRIRNNAEIKTITLNSYDPYGPLTSYILEELHLIQIIVMDSSHFESTSLPSLIIFNASESKFTISVFQDGKEAEYQLILTVQAQILMPGKNYYYPFDIQVYRSLFDNPLSSLAKSSEEDILLQEMRKQAAHQIASKLLLLLADDNKIN